MLVKTTRNDIAGIKEFLIELGEGEGGFTGTDFANGRVSLQTYLQHLEDMSEGRNIPSGWVQMTTFWFLDDQSGIVGMSRLRHRLTDTLLSKGGHIGYYIRRSMRRKGFGKKLLAATLAEAGKLGISKVLLTTDSRNVASIRTIEASGGKLEDIQCDSSGNLYGRYWINLPSL